MVCESQTIDESNSPLAKDLREIVREKVLNNETDESIYNYFRPTNKNLEDPNERDNLFLPFIDDTNGNESYGGGRYINLDIPQVDNLIIDFNSAFNPYCVYDEKYSCPIVPRENYLPLEIKAGVMNFLMD